MHIYVKDQTKDGKPTIMCVEREIQVCIILNADNERLETLATLAGAIGVKEVYLLAKASNVPNLLDSGWALPQARILLVKGTKGDKDAQST
jgi:hypothetical protein